MALFETRYTFFVTLVSLGCDVVEDGQALRAGEQVPGHPVSVTSAVEGDDIPVA